eukprot:TRINITY_DN4507_c0_g1_i1.p1 TRINITY_DN4507_c0_g1~~TRINITY_DN4507_c0_g1_i1.p1  ORF type:complete len:152 (+),score=12.43 TRINITY_DN4507_c0_g1_i1:36-491(+)
MSVDIDFEGVEKKLTMLWDTQHPQNRNLTLRNVSVDLWVEQLAKIGCSILSHSANPRFDAYILSESSLFVYENGVVIKTCGLIQLFGIVPFIINLGLEYFEAALPDLFSYMRREFFDPHSQHQPHHCWTDEVDYLSAYFPDGMFIFDHVRF